MAGTGARPFRVGFQVWGQHLTWAELMAVGHDIEWVGFDSLWSNDHFYPVVGSGDKVGGGRPSRGDGPFTLPGVLYRTVGVVAAAN